MKSLQTISMLTVLMVLPYAEPLLAISPPIKTLLGCVYVYSEQGVCSLCSNSDGTSLTISNCGRERVITNNCYNGTTFSACTLGVSQPIRASFGCTNHNYHNDLCLHVHEYPLYFPPDVSSMHFSCPSHRHLNCKHQRVFYCFPERLLGSCNNKHQECILSVFQADNDDKGLSEEVVCSDCSTRYLAGSITYHSGNETSRTPYPDCAEPRRFFPSVVIDGDSSRAAKTSLALFLSVNSYRTGNSHEEREQPLEDSLMPCMGVRIHNHYVLTSDYCGHSLQQSVMNHNQTCTALIKVFGAGLSEGIGYITQESVFHFSNAIDEAGQGDATLITLNAPAESTAFPEYQDQSLRLDHDLFLISATLGDAKEIDCFLEFDSSNPKLHEATFLEGRQDLWENEPVFWLNKQPQPAVLQLVGWVNSTREGCGYNFNEDCVAPITSNIEGWINTVLQGAPASGTLPDIPADGCFAVTTEVPTEPLTELPTNFTEANTTTDIIPAKPIPNKHILEIVVPVASLVTGIAIAIPIAILVGVCVIKARKRGQVEMERLN